MWFLGLLAGLVVGAVLGHVKARLPALFSVQLRGGLPRCESGASRQLGSGRSAPAG